MRECDLEFRAFVSVFEALTNRWDLADAELQVILRLDERDAAHSTRQIDVRTERRMRLLVELDRLLRLTLSETEVTGWLRSDPGDGLDPLTFMSLDDLHLSALVEAARARFETYAA